MCLRRLLWTLGHGAAVLGVAVVLVLVVVVLVVAVVAVVGVVGVVGVVVVVAAVSRAWSFSPPRVCLQKGPGTGMGGGMGARPDGAKDRAGGRA